MAILKKGIIGTPKGKIRNLMGYTRNGKGILQTVPTVKNKEARIYNIRKKVLEQRLLLIWDIDLLGIQATWNARAPISVTGLEFYLSTNLGFKAETLSIDPIYCVLALATNPQFFPWILNVNYTSKRLYIEFTTWPFFFTAPVLQQVLITALETDGTQRNLTLSWPDPNQNFANLSISSILRPTTYLVTFSLRNSGGFNRSSNYVASYRCEYSPLLDCQ